MDTITNWFAAQRWRMSLGHVLAALIVFSLLALLTGTPAAGAAFVLGWSWSREAPRLSVKTDGASNASVWLRALWPGTWPAASRLDFLAPAVLVLLLAAIIHWVTR